MLLATTALTQPLLLGQAQAQSLPAGGRVAAGSVAIGQPNAGQMTITQSSQGAVVNWQSFSVGQGNSVNIVQPNAASAMLNRVSGSAPSTIAGSVNANGQVYLVNPNGIAITSSGAVKVGGGFVASTLDTSDSDFMAGKRNFAGKGASAPVSNAGSISVGRGGYAALIGGAVSNSGTINVPLGKVGLGAGEKVTLDFSGDGFLQVSAPTATTRDGALITNSGAIRANGGSITISAATAREAARNAVNMSGLVQARSISGRSGAIRIGGGDGGTVQVSGALDASSPKAAGGEITVTGRDIALNAATVTASGATGGGAIRIGGDYQGQGTLQHAQTMTADAATVIKADAAKKGDGGRVVLWSDRKTSFAGKISAKGGAISGNGGQAEVSGKSLLDYAGFTDLTAAHGRFGRLLLDPYNVTISNGSDSNQTAFTATGDDSVINVTTLQNALGSADVVISTGAGGSQGGNIIVANSVSWTSASTLTLDAAGTIAVNAALSGANGNVTLQAGGDIAVNAVITAKAGTGIISLASTGGAITENASSGGLTGGSLAASAATNVTLQNTSNAIGTFAANAGGYVTLFNSTGITLDQVGILNGVVAFGDVVLATASTSDITQTANGKIIAGGGLLLQATAGSITLDQANSVGGNFAVVGTNNGDVSLRNTGNLNIGTVTVPSIGSFSGVAVNLSKTLSLISDSGSITQGSGVSERIVAGTIKGATAGGGMTLTNASNTIAALGATSLSGGALSLVNSSGSLTVTGAVSAGGGISLQTPGALTINDTLDGGTGTVSLVTTGANAAIIQNASGVITAGTLTLTTSDGAATLSAATNMVTNLGAVTLGAGALDLLNGTDLTVVGPVTADGGAAISNTGFIATTGTITTAHAEIALTATGDLTIGDTLTSNSGVISLEAGAGGTLTVNAPVDAGTADVFLTADDMAITSAVLSTGAVDIATATAGRAITLGDASTPAGLVIDNASGELNEFIGATVLNVGKTRAGTVNAGDIQIGLAAIAVDTINLFTTTGVVQVNPIVILGTGGSGAGTLDITAVDTVDLRPGVAAGLIKGSISGSGDFIAYGGGSGITVGPITTAGGEIAVGNNNGTLTVAGDLTSNGGNINAFSTGTLTLGANIDARGSGGFDGSMGLVSVAGINQTAGALMGQDLLAFLCNACIGSGVGDIALNGATNAIGGNVTLVNLTGGNIGFTDSLGYTIGGISSITYNTIGVLDVAPYTGLSSGAAGIRTTGASASVTLTAGGDIAQGTGADDVVSTNTLNIGRIAGADPNVTLDGFDSGGSGTDINTIANLGTVDVGQGTFTLYNLIDLTITGAATAGRGYYAESDGNLTQAAGANIDTSGHNGDLYLTAGCSCSGGLLTLNANLSAGTGNVYLAADTVTQAAGAIDVRTLNVQADTGAALNSATNSFSIVNALTDGDFSATTARSLRVGFVGVASNSGAVSLSVLGASSDITVPSSGSVFAGTDATLEAGRDLTITGAVLGLGTVSLTAGRDILVDGCGCGGGVSGTDVLLTSSRDITLDGLVGAVQDLALLADHDVIETANNQILATGLRAIATTGEVSLANSANHGIAIIAGSAGGDFEYAQDLSLTIGSVGSANGVASAAGGVTINAGTGDVTIDTLARVTAGGDVVLAGANFFNTRGSDAVSSTNGRWLIYANAAGTAADYNGLDSHNGAIWNTVYPAAVGASGDHYVFAAQPTLTFTTVDTSKTYGDDGTAGVAAAYAISGLQAVSGAFSDRASDVYSGVPTVTSSGSTVAATVAGGPYALAISGAGLTALNGYDFAFANPGQLSVTRRALTVTADNQSKVYNSGFTFNGTEFTTPAGGLVNGDTVTSVSLSSTGSGAAAGVAGGPYAIAASGAVGTGLDNYVLSYADGRMTVTPRALSITADSQTRIYGNANPALTYVVGAGGLVNGDTLTGALATTADTTSAVGSYAIAQGTLANANYSLTYTGANLAVTPRALTVIADAKTRIYGNANPALTYVVGGGGLVNGDSLAGALAAAADTTSAVGSYAITQGTLANANYSLTYTGANLSVTPRALTVTSNALSRAYGDANPALTYVIGGDGRVNGDTLTGTLVTAASTTSNVGNYSITQGTLAASPNYSLTYTGANLSVTPRALTVTSNALSRAYGDANPALTYVVGGGGLVNGDTLTGALATGASTASNVGNYSITQGTLAASPNYSLTYTGANLSITPRVLTVTSNALSRAYGNANPALTYVIGGGGLVNGDALTGALATGASTTSNVGSYGITQGTLAASPNYSLIYTGANLSITPRAITVTADNKSRLYGFDNPALTYAIGGSGLVNGDVPTGALATDAANLSGIGSYAITQGTLALNGNYAVTFNGGLLVVLPTPSDPELLAGMLVKEHFVPVSQLPADLKPVLGAPALFAAPGAGGLFSDPRRDRLYFCTSSACYAVPPPNAQTGALLRPGRRAEVQAAQAPRG